MNNTIIEPIVNEQIDAKKDVDQLVNRSTLNVRLILVENKKKIL